MGTHPHVGGCSLDVSRFQVSGDLERVYRNFGLLDFCAGETYTFAALASMTIITGRLILLTSFHGGRLKALQV